MGVIVRRWLFLGKTPANTLLLGYTTTDEVRNGFILFSGMFILSLLLMQTLMTGDHRLKSRL